MRMYNDFEYHMTDGVERYTMECGCGKVAVDHRDFPFGISVNILDATCDGFSNRDRIGDVNMVGISVCLLGSVVYDTGDEPHRCHIGTGCAGRPSNRNNTLRFPASGYRGISVGFTPSGLDLGGDMSHLDGLSALSSMADGDPMTFSCPPEVMALLYGMEEVLNKGGRDMDVSIRVLSHRLLSSIGELEPRVPDIPAHKDTDGLVDSVCLDLVRDGMGFTDSCSLHDVDPSVMIRRFRRIYGTTPSRFAHVHLMERAAGMILAGENRMGTVAGIAGYASESKFAMAFRDIFGIRPKHYRKGIMGPMNRA